MKNRGISLGICLIIPLLFSCTMPAFVQGTNLGVPACFHVSFKGTNDDSSFLIVFTNGSTTLTKNIALDLRVNAKTANQSSLGISVETDSFFGETSADVMISDGRLLKDSMPSMFMVGTTLLNEENNIVLAKTSDWKLIGNVSSRTAKPFTAMDGQGVSAIMVSSVFINNTDATLQASSILGYDQDTGVLVYAGASLGDILLREVGIDRIFGGVFRLSSFSENLGFNLIKFSVSPPIGLVLLLTSVTVILLTMVVLIYRAGKKKKRAHARIVIHKEQGKAKIKSERGHLNSAF